MRAGPRAGAGGGRNHSARASHVEEAGESDSSSCLAGRGGPEGYLSVAEEKGVRVPAFLYFTIASVENLGEGWVDSVFCDCLSLLMAMLATPHSPGPVLPV